MFSKNDHSDHLGFKPNKRLGQNFLINQGILDKIVEAAEIKKEDTILEVGPGLGSLTEALAKTGAHIISVEKDKALAKLMVEKFKAQTNVAIKEGDILKAPKEPWWQKLENYKVVANIPYYLTSPLIRMLLETEHPPELAVLMIQREVARRICAQPPRMNILAVSVQFYGRPKVVAKVSRGSFRPIPKVDSAVIKIDQIARPKNMDIKSFFKLVKCGFSSPRKQLVNNIYKVLNLDKDVLRNTLQDNGYNPLIRPENLSVQDWIKLQELISKTI